MALSSRLGHDPPTLRPWPPRGAPPAPPRCRARSTATSASSRSSSFDLVFVFAITQVTGRLADDPTWAGLARGLVVLGVLWWAWVAYAWLTNTVDPEEGIVRLAMWSSSCWGSSSGPWMARQARALAAERAERIRSQERAELAAHLHDSVLQTLALIQRRSGDARTVGTLARRQERELRQWLGGVAPAAAESSLAAALTAAAQEIEELHGVEVEVVTVGDCPLDDRLRALVGAAREAMANAARFSGAGKVDLYAEVGADTGVQAFVRDRGAGFDPASVPADRRGLRESIIGRMERHDGRARVESEPGEGTEVELTMERKS